MAGIALHHHRAVLLGVYQQVLLSHYLFFCNVDIKETFLIGVIAPAGGRHYSASGCILFED
jgi:hypothetical protein